MTIVHLRRWRVSAAGSMASLLLASLLATTAPGVTGRTHADLDPAVLAASGRTVNVIVQAVGSQAGRVATGVEHLGGRVTRHLPIIGGFSATVPTRTTTACRARRSRSRKSVATVANSPRQRDRRGRSATDRSLPVRL